MGKNKNIEGFLHSEPERTDRRELITRHSSLGTHHSKVVKYFLSKIIRKLPDHIPFHILEFDFAVLAHHFGVFVIVPPMAVHAVFYFIGDEEFVAAWLKLYIVMKECIRAEVFTGKHHGATFITDEVIVITFTAEVVGFDIDHEFSGYYFWGNHF